MEKTIEITEDYVSFEIAKLLKEKGFEGECSRFYMPNGHGRWKYEHYHDFDISDRIECPTLQMAMKWLREAHNLHCDIGYDDLDWSWNVISVSKDVPAGDRPRLIMNGYACNKTYEQACEAAIKYCLENLI